MDVISRDRVFLNSQLQYAASSDEFVRKLLCIYNAVPEDELRDGIQVGIHRSDYMVDKSSNDACKQIEINTIASSFGCLSKRYFTGYKIIHPFDLFLSLFTHLTY